MTKEEIYNILTLYDSIFGISDGGIARDIEYEAEVIEKAYNNEYNKKGIDI